MAEPLFDGPYSRSTKRRQSVDRQIEVEQEQDAKLRGPPPDDMSTPLSKRRHIEEPVMIKTKLLVTYRADIIILRYNSHSRDSDHQETDRINRLENPSLDNEHVETENLKACLMETQKRLIRDCVGHPMSHTLS